MTTCSLCALLVGVAAAGPPQVAPGFTDTTGVTLPRVDTLATIDGRLDEPVWSRAALLTGFYQFLPVDDRASEDSTHVLIWYAPNGIYFGIRAFETHAQVHATLADRDKISNDDYVQILLDTFDDQRQAVVLGVNPFGVQADGILKDAPRSTGAIAQADENLPYRIDHNPDFVYESKGRLTVYGYEVEVYVPFKSLRYQTDLIQKWGCNVIRRVQHSGYTDSWSKVLQNNASFLSQSGRLLNLTGLDRGVVLDFTPEVTTAMNGSQDDEGWKYHAPNPELGANLRWGLTNNLSLNATVNPDFSQIEADVQQISFDPRRAVFFPEKRPFFLDGIELFESPIPLIYTRRLSNPVGAVKLSGKISGTNVGIISGVDRRSTSISGEDYRMFNALRLSKDLHGQSTLGMTYTDKIDGDHTNRVASADGRLVFAEQYAVTIQGAGSFTKEGDGSGTVSAPSWLVSAEKSGRRFGLFARARGIHEDFNAETGFISQVDLASIYLGPRMTFFGREGSALESFTTSADMTWKWRYNDFVAGRGSLDRQFFINTRFVLRGGYTIGTSVLIEHFGYPEELYDNYYIERTDGSGAVVDTVAFTGTPAFDDLSFDLSFLTPRFSTFSANINLYYGRNVSFFEWADADLVNSRITLNWTPTDRVRIDFIYRHVQYIRLPDRSSVQIRRIPRLKIEYQLSRAIFVRFVGQYDSNQIDALRDDGRTNDAILLLGEDGTLERSGKIRNNDFRIDWLFSYRPTPGTVFFLGYGSSVTEPEPFRFRNLERLSDGFFLKASYLFRVK